MSVRLFHRGARLVLTLPWRSADPRARVWLALHRRPAAWNRILQPALTLLGIDAEAGHGELRFEGGGVRWTNGLFWTTIRVRWPPSSSKKAALRSMGLLKAARYAEARDPSPATGPV